MNKEQQELVNEAYKNYRSKSKDIDLPENLYNKLIDDLNKDAMFPIDNPNRMLTKEEFINKCKIDPELSEKWGLTIEERELSLDEKEWELEKTNCINDIETDRIIYGHEWEKYIQEQYEGIESTQGIKIPTKLITIKYNNKTIESYE
jgi:hypothetical protein